MPDIDQLWPASFRGMPFFVQNEGAKGGRRVVVHEFPNRDDPFLEDLGRAKREFSITAYVASDSVLADAAALGAVLDVDGPGVLVLPGLGPQLARLLTFDRTMERDTLGYVAFSLQFIAEGFSSALASVGALASQIFAAGDAVAAAAATLFESLQLGGFRGDLTTSAQADAETLIATVEAVRTSESIDPKVGTAVRDTLGDLFDDVPIAIARDTAPDGAFAQTLITAARDLVGGFNDPARAAAAFAAIADATIVPPAAGGTPNRAAAARNAAVLARLQRLVALTAYADALCLTKFASRSEGISARGEAAERFEQALGECSGGADVDLAVAIETLRGRVAAYLSKVITDLRPVVTVAAPVQLPALWWAQRLYGDASRALELVARNKVRHAGLMPVQFEAIAP